MLLGTAEPPTSSRLQRAQVPAVGLGVDRLQHRHPHRRHAGGERDLLVGQQVEHALRVELRAGQDERGADQRRGVRDAPRVGVEHRHDRQHRVARGDVHRVGQRRGQRVQDQRAVRVQDALGPAGGARRVTHRGGPALVRLGPLDRLARALEQRFVVDRAVRASRRSARRRSRARTRARRWNDSSTSSSVSSTMIARSSASVAMKPSSSGCRRGFSVWTTAPISGHARSTPRGARAGSTSALPRGRPRRCRAGRARRRDAGPRRAQSPIVVRCSAPSGRRETTLRPGVSRSARSTSAVSDSG